MTLTIELPDNLQAALRAQANAQGVSEAGYVCRVLERDLAASPAGASRAGMMRSQLAGQRIRELRKGNILPEGVTIRDLIEDSRG